MKAWTHPDAHRRIVRTVLPRGRAIVVGPDAPTVQLEDPETYGLRALGWAPSVEPKPPKKRRKNS